VHTLSEMSDGEDLTAVECRRRAQHYRERALAMPEANPTRSELLSLATEFERFARELERSGLKRLPPN
jgi:hypothetical protein